MAMGRPKIKINWEEFDKLCGLQCTLEEFAAYFKCCEDTIENRVKEEKGVTFSEYFRQKCGSGKISLRRKQFQTAMAGNATLLIWLGKQWLGQKEKNEFSTDDKQPLILNYNLEVNNDQISEKKEDK